MSALAEVAVIASDDFVHVACDTLASYVARTTDGVIVVLRLTLKSQGSLNAPLPLRGRIAVLRS